MAFLDSLLIHCPIPDRVIRKGIRSQLRHRLRVERQRFQTVTLADVAHDLAQQAITIETDAANSQHYEVPTEFYDLVLGPYKKYSCGLWTREPASFDLSETDMLALTCERADIQNGQTILDLGCGWGSFSLYAAERFQDSHITAVSNSSTQRAYIEAQAAQRGLTNIRVLTQDVASLMFETSFDRIVSVEMLEHVRNYQVLFKRIASWLKPDGLFFIHVFGHKTLSYVFDDEVQSSWMARHFFSGGQMPAKDLFSFFQEDLTIQSTWVVNGQHYQKTCRAWLENMDANRSDIMALFEATYGGEARRFWVYWRLFFMACEELFGFDEGEEWQVYHYGVRPRRLISNRAN